MVNENPKYLGDNWNATLYSCKRDVRGETGPFNPPADERPIILLEFPFNNTARLLRETGNGALTVNKIVDSMINSDYFGGRLPDCVADSEISFERQQVVLTSISDMTRRERRVCENLASFIPAFYCEESMEDGVVGFTEQSGSYQSPDNSLHWGLYLNPRVFAFTEIRKVPRPFKRKHEEFARLEGFSETNLGKRHRSGLHKEERRVNYPYDLKSVKDCDELIEYAREHRGLGREKFYWFGLDLMFPDPDERLQRIKDFHKNWYPGEWEKVALEGDECKAWLRSLKSEE